MAVNPAYMLASNGESPFYGAARSMAQVLAGLGGEAPDPGELPPGWLRSRWKGWESWSPYDYRPRLQGWKIHISTIPAEAQETLRRAVTVCLSHYVSFKFRYEAGSLDDINGKQHDRGSSGKFITIYPRDDDQLALLLEELEETLSGHHGPYILSDLRYGIAPVFVRYGGIIGMSYTDTDDNPVYAIVDQTMRLIPDERRPRFTVPEGVQIPACLQKSYARSREKSASRINEFVGLSPLHFSNAGGVYRATLADGTEHILREARSNTGLDARGRDAVVRQEEEETILCDLVGVTGVQQLVGSFWAWEHRYLELEFAPGAALTSWIVRNTPFHQDEQAVATYAARAARIGEQLVSIVEAVHARGWAIGDLHPGNVIVNDDDSVTLIDFEDATRIDSDRTIGFRVFEFCGPEHFTAVESDWYAIARCLMLMYVPDWDLEIIAPRYWEQSLNKVEQLFGTANADQIRAVSERFPETPVHALSPQITVSSWTSSTLDSSVVDALDAGIAWSRGFSAVGTYPGDPLQGDTGESLGYGRAGVVWSRTRYGVRSDQKDLDALEAAASADASDVGLLTGRAGMALALYDAGRHDAAVRVAHETLTASLARQRLDLHAGQCGVLLAALEIGRSSGDATLLQDALVANERLQQAVQPGTSAWEDITRRRGLAYGPTGLALLDLVAHLASNSEQPLLRARARLREELDACVTTPTGELDVRDHVNNRALPYVAWGSAGVWGITTMAERLSGERIVTDREAMGLTRACTSDLYVYNTLAQGRAGTLAVLAAVRGADDPLVQRQVTFVLNHLMTRDDMLLVPGDGMMRLSSDLCTGAAGIAVVLHGVLNAEPFLWVPILANTAREFGTLAVPQKINNVRNECCDERLVPVEMY